MLNGERKLGATFAPDDIGWIDFETRSVVTSIKDGTYRYANNANAIICAWAIGNAAVNVTAVPDFGRLMRWSEMPSQLTEFHARVCDGKAIWCAWNAGFDRAIWNFASQGFPELKPHQTIDAMVQATASGLPSDLAMASKYSGSWRKLDTGRKLINLFCLVGATATPQSHPAEWKLFCDYAAGDIEAMRSIFKCTRQLSLAEWREYWAVEAINDRGIGIDLDMVHHAARLAEIDKHRSAQEIFATTRGAVKTVDYVSDMTTWLLEQLPPVGQNILLKRPAETDSDGVVTRPAKFTLRRPQVEELLAYIGAVMEDVDTPASVLAQLVKAQRVLQIRLYGGSKTPAKFAKMRDQQVDGKLFGQYVFGGAAQTGRASSKGVQIHNLARDTLVYEHEAIEALLNRCDYDTLAALGDDAPVSRKLSLLIRPAFVPDLGRVFVWSDWSQIEARVLPWLAGNDPGALTRLQIFRDVDADPSLPDLYTRTASVLSHLPIDQVTKPIRQSGKVAELALGFGGGIGALQNMATALKLYLPDQQAKVIVDRWRSANPWCVNFWGSLWDAIERALAAPNTPQRAGRIIYIYVTKLLAGSLLCMLPSGRCLTYRDIRREKVAELDDDDEIIGYSVKLRFGRGRNRIPFWHGMACENVVQAVAADCLRGTLRRLEDEGFQTRLHTHDEVLIESDEVDAELDLAALREVMRRGFEWSYGLPLMSEETISPYYTKLGG